MVSSPLHLMHFEGGDALAAFRARTLLARLQAVCPRVTAVGARHVHWAAFEQTPDRATVDKLAALLQYGDAAQADRGGELVLVMPRLGTVSPWASKASDIARNCGLALHRVERVVEYRLALERRLLGAAREAGRALGCGVRCEPGRDVPGVRSDEDVLLELEGGQERVVPGDFGPPSPPDDDA